MVFFLVGIVFGLGYLIQLIYLLPIFGRTAFYSRKKVTQTDNFQEGVSVVIRAKNQYKTLKNLIPALFEQEYPEVEIVVIDDRSWDRTPRLLRELKLQYPNLRVVSIDSIPDHVSSGKYALTLGIKAAHYDVILLTEADCMPGSPQWIKKMTAPIRTRNKIFAIGYAGYFPTRSFLERWIQFETLKTALFYCSFALWKAPFMAVGKNLALRKGFFLEKKAFNGMWKILGGEDDLFVNRYASSKNTEVVIDPEASVLSNQKKKWRGYFMQKKWQLNILKQYGFADQLKIGLYAISHFFIWVGGLILLINFGLMHNWEQFMLVFSMFILRALVLLVIFSQAEKKFTGSKSQQNILINDFLYLGYFLGLRILPYQST